MEQNGCLIKYNEVTMSNNTTDLIDKYAYSKKVITDKNKLETMLVKHIQQICHERGYTLVEIKIQKHNDTP